MTVDDLAVGAEATETRLRIDLWSDLGWPWCYVGKHRIQTAIETAGLQADIVLRSFELDPRAAAKPVPVAEMFASKFGGSARDIPAMESRIGQLAEAEGLPLNTERWNGNTLTVHRMLKLAQRHGPDRRSSPERRPALPLTSPVRP